jgi:hypothetical protein
MKMLPQTRKNTLLEQITDDIPGHGDHEAIGMTSTHDVGITPDRTSSNEDEVWIPIPAARSIFDVNYFGHTSSVSTIFGRRIEIPPP